MIPGSSEKDQVSFHGSEEGPLHFFFQKKREFLVEAKKDGIEEVATDIGEVLVATGGDEPGSEEPNVEGSGAVLDVGGDESDAEVPGPDGGRHGAEML